MPKCINHSGICDEVMTSADQDFCLKRILKLVSNAVTVYVWEIMMTEVNLDYFFPRAFAASSDISATL